MSLTAWVGFAGVALRLISAPKDPEDQPETLSLLNEIAQQRLQVNFADPRTKRLSEGFSVEGRGYDARLNGVFAPGYPTAWVVFPDDYRAKVGLHPQLDALLDEDSSKVRA